MESNRKAQSTPVTSQAQSGSDNRSSDTQNDRMAQLAAARARALEVRKQRAEEKKQLKQEEQESERLRLQKVKMENEKIRKELENNSDVNKEDKSPDPPSPKKVEEGAPSTSFPSRKRERSASPPPAPVAEEEVDEDVPHPTTYLAQRLDHLTSMFEEEMNYKKAKRAKKDEDAKKVAQQRRLDPGYTAYVSGMRKTRDNMLMSHVFGN